MKKEKIQDKFNIVIQYTFDNEEDEQEYIRQLLKSMMEQYSIGVYIKDLDVDIIKYKDFFSCEYHILEENTTYPVIIARELNEKTLDNIINNWGFYTLDACFFVVKEKDILVREKIGIRDKLRNGTIGLMITQILDFSIEVAISTIFYYENEHFFNEIL